MDAILLFSHGSVLCGAERNLIELADRMQQRGAAPIVGVAFLNYTEPRLAEAVQRCVDRGARRIIIAPYFLISGKFVVEDLPILVRQARTAHPDVEFRVASVVGFHPRLADAVLSAAKRSRSPAGWRDEILAVGDWCREDPRCPIYGSEACRIHDGATA